MSTILFIDDQSEFPERLRLSVIDAGYNWQIDHEAYGRLALSRLSEKAYDVVIVDWDFSETDNTAGSLLAQSIVKQHPGIPVLALSQFATEELAEEENQLPLYQEQNIKHCSKTNAFGAPHYQSDSAVKFWDPGRVVELIEQVLSDPSRKWQY